MMENKWRIEDQNSGISTTYYEVPRIYLKFDMENSYKFVKRMQRAVEQRDECENYLRFETMLDNFPMVNIPLPPVYYGERIKDMLFHSCTHEQWNEIYQEHCIVYQRAFAAFQMIKFLTTSKSRSSNKRSGSGSFVQIQLPRQEKRKLKNLTMHQQSEWNSEFKKSKKSIQQLWIYCCPQSIKIMEFISCECQNVSRMSLFHLQETPCSWSDFVSENNRKLLFMSNFLQTTWIDRIVGEIQIYFGSLKGWFDLNVNSWYIFKISKLYAFIELIKIRMEDAVVMLLNSSLLAFVNHFCQPCECLVDTTDDYEWNDDLTFSPFKASSLVFHIHLNIEEEPTYSIQLNSVENDIVEIFVHRILATHHIPQIDRYLITQLKFDKYLKISSIGLVNQDIQHQIMHLRQCYRKCLIPLNAYAKKFQKYTELKHLKIDEYIKAHEPKFSEQNYFFNLFDILKSIK
jgi:dynein heavy chain, axonemal